MNYFNYCTTIESLLVKYQIVQHMCWDLYRNANQYLFEENETDDKKFIKILRERYFNLEKEYHERFWELLREEYYGL
jgi:site-specific DNA-adenine methylase